MSFITSSTMLPVEQVFLVLLLCWLPLSISNEEQHALSVATYNIWNVMFNWEVRKLRIAQMVKEHSPEIVAFQEIRFDADGGRNQIHELHSHLRMYRWHLFAGNNDVIPMKNVYMKGWEKEGVGLLSQLPVVNSTSWALTYHTGPDQNHRMVLHACIEARPKHFINVLVVHFSYDRHQQCGNALEIRSYINKYDLKNVIILGDFNTYKDYDYPLQIISKMDNKRKNFCPKATERLQAVDSWNRLTDAWSSVHPDSTGYSFSNMPIPGLESRPDRILVGDSFTVHSASLHGDGTVYKERYMYHILWRRLENVIRTMLDSYHGMEGRSCMHDCGPHASCRCGVCVAVGDKAMCVLPACEECSGRQWVLLVAVLAVLLLSLGALIYSMLQLLQMLHRETEARLAGAFSAYCCLLNPVLYSGTRRPSPRPGLVRRLLPCLRLPPMILVMGSVLFLLFFAEAVLMMFDQAIQDVYGMLPEERYPSDHLMLRAEVTWGEVT